MSFKLQMKLFPRISFILYICVFANRIQLRWMLPNCKFSRNWCQYIKFNIPIQIQLTFLVKIFLRKQNQATFVNDIGAIELKEIKITKNRRLNV